MVSIFSGVSLSLSNVILHSHYERDTYEAIYLLVVLALSFSMFPSVVRSFGISVGSFRRSLQTMHSQYTPMISVSI
jgi:hypothetical protein